jgi:hypothetical protein
MPVREDTQLKFRVAPELKSRLETSARAHHRSMNMEVVARLERLFTIEDALAAQLPEGDELRGELALTRLLTMLSVKSDDRKLDRLLELGTNPGDVHARLVALEAQVEHLARAKRKR